jgi:hypothetical protein
MLAILIARAKEDAQISSLVPQLVDGDISILNMQMILSYSWNLILQKL